MKQLKKGRVVLATVFALLITLLFLDFTGSLHAGLAWMAKIQFMPALLALNLGVVLALLLLSLLLGRVYCSIICPLGVFQDAVARLRRKKNKYRYSRALTGLRYGFLVLFVGAFFAGISSVVALLEPYSAYGRMASELLAPIYQGANHVLAYLAERVGSYAFYEKELWIKSATTLVAALATLLLVGLLSWRGGRTYCNTVCPVGTVLGFFSQFSLYKHRIDPDKCNSCGLCARNCKASCIDPESHTIDYTRCVSCFNCLQTCKQKAISYDRRRRPRRASAEGPQPPKVDDSRRKMLGVAGLWMATSTLKAQEKKVDGGLAFIEDKKIPTRQTALVPPGGEGIRHFGKHCSACQLCVSACPNQVLRPSSDLATFMQPEMSYERGYCRPECTRCSEVCPTGAIQKITAADKSALQIGHAVWIEKNCVVLTDGVSCGNCARHCPVGAISMVETTQGSHLGQKIPVVNEERCIGCGACENLCPARPFSAIYVEGHAQHRTV